MWQNFIYNIIVQEYVQFQFLVSFVGSSERKDTFENVGFFLTFSRKSKLILGRAFVRLHIFLFDTFWDKQLNFRPDWHTFL